MEDTDTTLAAQLEALLQQVASGIATEESARLAESRAVAIRLSAADFSPADHSIEDVEALRRYAKGYPGWPQAVG